MKPKQQPRLKLSSLEWAIIDVCKNPAMSLSDKVNALIRISPYYNTMDLVAKLAPDRRAKLPGKGKL